VRPVDAGGREGNRCWKIGLLFAFNTGWLVDVHDQGDISKTNVAGCAARHLGVQYSGYEDRSTWLPSEDIVK